MMKLHNMHKIGDFVWKHNKKLSILLLCIFHLRLLVIPSITRGAARFVNTKKFQLIQGNVAFAFIWREQTYIN